jgi:hypothetical protein
LLAGFQDVIVRGLSVSAIWAEVGALLTFAPAFFWFFPPGFRFK